MVGLSVKELELIIEEIEGFLPFYIQEIWQEKDETVMFKIYNKGSPFKFFIISVEAPFSRLHLAKEKFFEPQVTSSPFTMLLRKYLKGTPLLKIEQRARDRTVSLYFPAHKIVAELSGRHGNIFLLDHSDTILGSIRKNRSTLRDLVPGNKYEFPKSMPPEGLLSTARFLPPEVNLKVEEYYSQEISKYRVEEVKHRILVTLRRELKREERKKENIKKDIEAADKAPLYRKYGELLSLNFSLLRRGLEEIEVEDIYENSLIKIPLDPKLPPQKNVELYFKKAKKLEVGRRVAVKRLEITKQRIESIQVLMKKVESASKLEAIEFLKKEVEKEGIKILSASETHRRCSSRHLPYHSFYISSGKEVLVGKSKKDNHELTFKIANGRDLWFHVRDMPGSHVILRLDKNETPTSLDIIEVAMLAAHYSSARGEKKVEVIYTPRKYISPVKRELGVVKVIKEKVILVEVDYQRLERILKTRH